MDHESRWMERALLSLRLSHTQLAPGLQLEETPKLLYRTARCKAVFPLESKRPTSRLAFPTDDRSRTRIVFAARVLPAIIASIRGVWPLKSCAFIPWWNLRRAFVAPTIPR